MTIRQLIDKYDFHDSLIKYIAVNKEENTVRITLDFACWMQFDYDDNVPETAIKTLIFYNVNSYSGPIGNIDYFSILKIELDGMNIKIIALDDINGEYYEITFNSSSVVF